MFGVVPSRIARRRTGRAKPSISRKRIPGASVTVGFSTRRATRRATRSVYVSSSSIPATTLAAMLIAVAMSDTANASANPSTCRCCDAMFDAMSRIAASSARTSRNPSASVNGSRSAATTGGRSALSTATIAAMMIAPPKLLMSAPGTIPVASSSASADTSHAATRRTGCRRRNSGRHAVAGVRSSVTRASELLAQAAEREGAEDVGDALHQGPDPGEDEQRVGLLDEELPARPERQHDHQYAADQAEPPHRVLLALDERADRPPHADREEQEAEDVGHPRERVLRVDEADDAGDDEQHAEDRPQPAQRVGDRGEHELLHARDDEHDPDDDADRRDRRLVELEDGERRDDPRDAEDQLDPPEAGELARDLCPLGYGDIAHLGRRCRTAHAVLLARLVAVEDTVLRRRELGVVEHTRPVQLVEALEVGDGRGAAGAGRHEVALHRRAGRDRRARPARELLRACHRRPALAALGVRVLARDLAAQRLDAREDQRDQDERRNRPPRALGRAPQEHEEDHAGRHAVRDAPVAQVRRHRPAQADGEAHRPGEPRAGDDDEPVGDRRPRDVPEQRGPDLPDVADGGLERCGAREAVDDLVAQDLLRDEPAEAGQHEREAGGAQDLPSLPRAQGDRAAEASEHQDDEQRGERLERLADACTVASWLERTMRICAADGGIFAATRPPTPVRCAMSSSMDFRFSVTVPFCVETVLPPPSMTST